MGFSTFPSFIMSPSSQSVAPVNNDTPAQHNVGQNSQQQCPVTSHLAEKEGESINNDDNDDDDDDDYLQPENLNVPQRYTMTNTSFQRSLLTGVDVNLEGPVQHHDQADLQPQPPGDHPPLDSASCLQPYSTRITDVFVESFTRSKSFMELIVGHANDIHKFVVSEAHLRNLSQAWDETVVRHSSFAQRKWVVRKFTKRIRVLRLPEEDPRAIRLILYIAHHHFSKLPEELDFKDIVRLVEVSQRYNTMHLPQPYLKHWLSLYTNKLYDPGFEEWLYIGRHVLHASRAYIQVAQHLKLHCWTGDDGELLMPGSEKPITGLFPPRALRKLLLLNLKDTRTHFWQTKSNLIVLNSSIPS